MLLGLAGLWVEPFVLALGTAGTALLQKNGLHRALSRLGATGSQARAERTCTPSLLVWCWWRATQHSIINLLAKLLGAMTLSVVYILHIYGEYMHVVLQCW